MHKYCVIEWCIWLWSCVIQQWYAWFWWLWNGMDLEWMNEWLSGASNIAASVSKGCDSKGVAFEYKRGSKIPCPFSDIFCFSFFNILLFSTYLNYSLKQFLKSLSSLIFYVLAMAQWLLAHIYISTTFSSSRPEPNRPPSDREPAALPLRHGHRRSYASVHVVWSVWWWWCVCGGLTIGECGMQERRQLGGAACGWRVLLGFSHFGVGFGELEPNRLRQIRIESHTL